jgi:two-component system sensor histidine kinase/response regulator
MIADPSLSTSPTLSGAALARSEILLASHRAKICARTDRHLSALIVAEWIAVVLTALIVSPLTWSGAASGIHAHLVAAVLLGGLIAIPTLVIAGRSHGRTYTRHVVAVAQMLMGALLIDVTGGRIESHFYFFGSLAFLAFYRDWRVIVTASLVVVVEHVLGAAFSPEAIFGVAHSSL